MDWKVVAIVVGCFVVGFLAVTYLTKVFRDAKTLDEERRKRD